MSYLGEEVHRESLGFASGLYIAGNAFGGMVGRLLAAFVDDLAGWRWALAVAGMVALACAVAFGCTCRVRRFSPARAAAPGIGRFDRPRTATPACWGCSPPASC